MKKYNIINNALGWVCFVIAAVTYLLTIEPTASFWDCPEFTAQGAKLEVGHPPGNPIFMLTARFFVTMLGNDVANAAVAVNTMSALLSAATILLLFWAITHLVRRIMVDDDKKEISRRRMAVIMGSGLCGALAYTWSDTFWFSAVESEVYAFSSFCTALVFWLILKWENRAEQPHSDRYLVLIAYIIGVSIAVHLLNLLCIPAIVLVFYYHKNKNADAKGSLIALGVSVVIVALILYGLVPGYIKVAQFFELFFVNSLHMGYNSGVIAYGIVLLAVFVAAIYAINKGKNPAAIKVLSALVVVLSGLTFITSSALVWALLIIALLVYLGFFCPKVPVRVFNVVILSIFFIFVGYSSYALLLIRASANTPMNQNAPDNVFTLSSYLNREQYGQRPLFYGPTFADTYETVKDKDGNVYIAIDDNGLPKLRGLTTGDAIYYTPTGELSKTDTKSYRKKVKLHPGDPDEYEETITTTDYKYSPDICIPFTRIYSFDANHVEGYKGWSLYENPDFKNIPINVRDQWRRDGYVPLYEAMPYLSHLKMMRQVEGNPDYATPVWKPSFLDNLKYFFNYQLNHMYWRYFMWNFVGRQNDIQGNGEPNLGNWISGIPFIDNPRLGDQSLVPAEYTTDNKGHNVFYMLPLLMGIFGIIWQSVCVHRRNPKRGIEQFWVIFFLFFMTGIAIVLYLNQTPGQPRERDYAFAGSFYAFSIWVGMGVAAVSRFIIWAATGGFKKTPDQRTKTAAAVAACLVGLIVPLQMVSQTWDDHDRSHRYTTRDFGANYLNSLADDAIIFTNGDNDTFPLWYMQEVEGERTDVRVVNLSYLSTDWYANQLKHPYYDAAAVPMLAQPKDYSSDNLLYGRVSARTSDTIPALEGLRRMYEAGEGVLTTPNMYAPVDTIKAIEAFGVKATAADSINKLAYLGDIEMPGLAGNGFYLNKLLSFDIVANSVSDGFARPVYFATTVPGMYCLGLEPYMYSTGVAKQVAPFKNAPISPVADKAYENVVSKFRWGGLDDPKHNQGLYLDETVRRMVSTMRNSLTEIAAEHIKLGDLPASEFAVQWAQQNGQAVPQTHYDMARHLLELSEEKLPVEAMKHESMTDISLISMYLQLYAGTGNPDDLAAAQRLLDSAIDRYAKLARYSLSLSPSRQAALGIGDTYMLYRLPTLILYKQYVDNFAALRDNPDVAEALNLVNASLDIDAMIYPATYAYTGNEASFEFTNEADFYKEKRPDISQILYVSAAIAELDEALGLDRQAVVNQILAPYGLNQNMLSQVAK